MSGPGAFALKMNNGKCNEIVNYHQGSAKDKRKPKLISLELEVTVPFRSQRP